MTGRMRHSGKCRMLHVTRMFSRVFAMEKPCKLSRACVRGKRPFPRPVWMHHAACAPSCDARMMCAAAWSAAAAAAGRKRPFAPQLGGGLTACGHWPMRVVWAAKTFSWGLARRPCRTRAAARRLRHACCDAHRTSLAWGRVAHGWLMCGAGRKRPFPGARAGATCGMRGHMRQRQMHRLQ